MRLPPGIRWCYDFVFDACANGQQLKCLTLVDEYTGMPGHRRGRIDPVAPRLTS
ncbi:MAG: hypothetical protein IPH41_04780 [Sulfuritalea sp.]|nr:hypothetical protein [Sulfuritalea sp.]